MATTTNCLDNEIEQWCAENEVECYRGSEEGVLQRDVFASCNYKADIVVQMGADSACHDYNLTDCLLEKFMSSDYDYVCNDKIHTYPSGIKGHIVYTEILQKLQNCIDMVESFSDF